MPTLDAREEATKQWTNDPCGYVLAKDHAIGTKEFYDRVDQSRYDEYAPWLKTLIHKTNPQNKKLLEIGFGMGTDLFQFASLGAEVYGIDLSPKHLEIATKRFNLYNLPANLQLADATSIPFPDNTFDMVYTMGVIHHIDDTQKVINEIHRVLKPGGEAIIIVYRHFSAFFFCGICEFPSALTLKYLFNKEYRPIKKGSIEHRENSDAVPLVKLYSKKSLSKMLSAFSKYDLDVAHLGRDHFVRLQNLIPERLIPKLENKLGWYLIARCKK